ncbi:hypothetical protein P7K49_009924 [Saguinus oedipus]|uniref:Uncharacterized protein n=1 Tax=Saguinus oedipus TaxID=9490 RepID=A0ABQ9VLD4_SAGOE|nr:hypothetical protein P7K49_009924 [Saguinus oedipus]
MNASSEGESFAGSVQSKCFSGRSERSGAQCALRGPGPSTSATQPAGPGPRNRGDGPEPRLGDRSGRAVQGAPEWAWGGGAPDPTQDGGRSPALRDPWEGNGGGGHSVQTIATPSGHSRPTRRKNCVPGGTTVLVELTPDIHICGICKQQFNNLDAFVAHKQSGCQLTGTSATAPSTVQFVSEETVPATQTQTTTRTITSETQTITGYISEPE